MKKVLTSLVIALSLLGVSLTPLNAAETGKPDPTPTPFLSCGGILCSYFSGKYFQFLGLDIKSQAQVTNIGQFPCQVNELIGTDYCRVFPKNALPSNNLTSMVLKGGFVEIGQATICEEALEITCRKNPLPSMKIVLAGGKATFDQYPYPGFTFSSDRKTLYIVENSTMDSLVALPKILVKEVGRVTVAAYLEVSAGEYSSEASDEGSILVKSEFDNFVFQTLTRKDLRKNPKIIVKPIQKEITCIKGKVSKQILKTNIYDNKCPPGFKNK